MDDFKCVGLCYHYIRSVQSRSEFPRIIGHSFEQFQEHIETIHRNHRFLDPTECCSRNVSKSVRSLNVLLTFDDGLSEHYEVARYLADRKIKAIFFIPSLILTDNIPIYPIILHHVIAIFGVDEFLRCYRLALKEFKLSDQFNVTYQKGKDDPWKTISQIKSILKYQFKINDTERVVKFIYEKLLLKKYPDFKNRVHLTIKQLKEMILMGHTLGVHSHSHASLASPGVTEEDFRREMEEPRVHFKRFLGMEPILFSYPFGRKKDYAPALKYLNHHPIYEGAFTVEEAINTSETSKFELNRLMPEINATGQSLLESLSFLQFKKHHLGFVVTPEQRNKIEAQYQKQFVFDPTQQTHTFIVFDQTIDLYREYICQEGRAKNLKPGFSHVCYQFESREKLEEAEHYIRQSKLGYRVTQLEKAALPECGWVEFYFIKNKGLIEFSIPNGNSKS